MIRAIHKRLEDKEEGFTLIELLVVVIIIGILAAIAIPVFLNQRERAWRSALSSDLRNAAIEFETYYTDNGRYPTTAILTGTPTADEVLITSSPQVASPVVRTNTPRQAYCIELTHNNLITPDNTQAFRSDLGGLQGFPSTCPATMP